VLVPLIPSSGNVDYEDVFVLPKDEEISPPKKKKTKAKVRRAVFIFAC
jgi:hypothetical protein